MERRKRRCKERNSEEWREGNENVRKGRKKSVKNYKKW